MKKSARWHLPQRRLMPAHLASWLTDKHSLTRRLKLYSQHEFSVQLLVSKWARPLLDESQYLSVPVSVLTYQREVRLMDGDTANVYARTVVPRATFNTLQYRFDRLGTHSLGELLFTDPRVQSTPIEIAKLRPGQFLYEMAILHENARPPALWGRRRAFYINGKKLLISEIFLPALAGA